MVRAIVSQLRRRHVLRPPAAVVAVGAFYEASPKLTIAALVVATVLGLLQPAFVVVTGAVVQAAASGASMLLPLALLGVVFCLTRMLGPLRDELGNALWRRVDQSMGDRLMRAMSAQAGLQHVEDARVQDLLAQAEGAVTGYTVGPAAQQLPMMWSQRTYALVCLLIVFRTYWWAAAVLGLMHVLGYSGARWHWHEVTVFILGRTDQLRRSFYLRDLALSSRMAKETRVFGLARWLVERYRASALDVLREIWGKRHEGWRIGIGLAILLSLTEALIIWMVAFDSFAGRLSLGTAVATIQAVFAAALLSQYQDPDWIVAQAAVSIRNVRELEQATPDTNYEPKGGHTDVGEAPRSSICFENVSFRYPDSTRKVFDNFNLTIPAGHSLAIVGENGAGKTTLVKLLARLYEPTSGCITVDGTDVRELDPAAWHRRIAAVFQDFTQFELSAYENVGFGALHAFDDALGVEQAARHAGALGLVERLPHGWETLLSRELTSGSQLSGGEWQRLALARALFGVQAGAGILILDEPTASMDVRGEAEVYQRFLQLTRGVTTIVISHRFSTVRRAERIVVIDHGQVVESGTHDELMALPGGRYATMYALQASRFATSPIETNA